MPHNDLLLPAANVDLLAGPARHSHGKLLSWLNRNVDKAAGICHAISCVFLNGGPYLKWLSLSC